MAAGGNRNPKHEERGEGGHNGRRAPCYDTAAAAVAVAAALTDPRDGGPARGGRSGPQGQMDPAYLYSGTTALPGTAGFMFHLNP